MASEQPLLSDDHEHDDPDLKGVIEAAFGPGAFDLITAAEQPDPAECAGDPGGDRHSFGG